MNRSHPGSSLRRVLIALLPLASLALLAIPAAADPEDRLDSIQERQDKVENRIEKTDQQGDSLARRVQALDEKRAAAESEVETLSGKVARLDSVIADVRAELTAAQLRLTALSEQLDEYQAQLEARMETFQDRAVAAYVAGPSAPMDGLLSAEDFSDLVERFTYYESALNTDSELIVEIQRLEEITEERRAEVEANKNQIASQKLRLEQDRAKVYTLREQRANVLAAREEAISQKRSILSGVRSRQARLERIDAQLEADSNEIQAILSAPTGGSAPAPPSIGSPQDGGQLLWPANGPVTSGYGYRVHPIFGTRTLHAGIDIGAAYGSPAWAADAGTVSYVGAMSGYGNVVIVDHGGGLATTYNHLSAFSVSSGESVGRGQQVGAIGCTGYCTGPHLHFEVRVNGSPVDPMPYLQ
ncbi:MAG: peptidoglycan DD-metalloendopeptidase family protein [Actinomycetota bacterium]|nr:peptidoglycan DD-metalloendopeptidase family protein [Actinomycetota bacterium]